MKLGAHCVLYGPEVKENTDGVIGRLARAGAEGCEIGERFFGTDERDRLTAVLDKYHVHMSAMHCNGLKLIELINDPQKARDALFHTAQFVAPLPEKNVVASGGVAGSVADVETMKTCTLGQGAPEPELHDPVLVRRMAENLNAIVKDIRAEYGVQVHYHNHSWEFADNGLIWFTLADYAPDLCFALDTGWAAVSGYDPVDLMNRYPGRFHYLHLRDYIPSDDIASLKFDDVHKGYVQLGTGAMNYPRLMRKLNQELSADDWAVVEYEIGNFDENSYLAALSYLRGIRDILN